MRSRLTHAVALAIVTAAILTLFEPLKSALFNSDELSFGFTDLLVGLVVPFLVAATVLAIAWMACAVLMPRRGVALLTALLVCLAVQGSIFVWNYGQFDGSPIDWDAHFGKGVLDAAFWAAMLLLAIVRPGLLARYAADAVKLVLVFQLLGLAAAWLQVRPLAAKHGESSAERAVATTDGNGELLIPSGATPSAVVTNSAADRDLVAFSRERNVLLVVLDTFQSDFFAELLQDPEVAASIPPGFTYYRNAISTYPTTFLSLQNILTSRVGAKKSGLKRWRVAQMKRSVPAKLADRDYGVSLLVGYPQWLACDSLGSRLPCTAPVSLVAHFSGDEAADRFRTEEVRSLLGVASFRVSPHFLRPWVYAGGQWRIATLYGSDAALGSTDTRIAVDSRRDIVILRELASRATTAAVAPTFKFLHFSGAHPPVTTDRDCAFLPTGNAADTDAVRAAFVGTAGCVLGLTFDFLKRLDELGVYDESLIFVVGDHGQVDVPLDARFASPDIAGADSSGRGGEMSRGVPLLLAKRVGDRSPLRTSDAPVSLCDIPASIFSELGVPGAFACESIFDIVDRRATPRFHFTKVFEQGRNPWGPQRGPFGWYQVEGHSWLDDSWHRIDEKR